MTLTHASEVVHTSSSVQCDGPECRAFTWWNDGWDLGAMKEYIPLQYGDKDLHFCSVRCLSKWSAVEMERQYIERIQEINELTVANMTLKKQTQKTEDEGAAIL
jgi:hypothetical protein